MTVDKRLRPDAWYKLRWTILERDSFTCQYCGQFAPNVMLHVDHRVEVCNGGTNDPDNLITSCAACNWGKEGLRASPQRTAQNLLLADAIRTGAHIATDKRREGLADTMAALLRNGPMTTVEIADAIGAPRKNALAVLAHHRGKRFISEGAAGGGPKNFLTWRLHPSWQPV